MYKSVLLMPCVDLMLLALWYSLLVSEGLVMAASSAKVYVYQHPLLLLSVKVFQDQPG